jgi:predicted TIM-barrel fold metal-dependent hydrolase
MVFGSDMPHGDRETFVVRKVQARKDISDAAKLKILETNPARLYGFQV